MLDRYATHEPLFLRGRTSVDLFAEKVAAALSRVPDDEKKWPAHVFSELCKEFPYMTQYDIEIVIDRMDPEAGAALGYAQVQNKTQSRPQEAAMAAGNVIRVPIIIKDRRLQKFYIFEAGGQTYPMGEGRIQQAMLNPLVFDTDAARVPQSPGLLDQIYPPGQQRTGFGRVSDPVSMGLTKLNSSPLRELLKLARTPETADAYAGVAGVGYRANKAMHRKAADAPIPLGAAAAGLLGGFYSGMKDMLARRKDHEKDGEHTPAPAPEVVVSALQPVLSALLALHQLYYFAHWTSQGEAAYSAHQLFTRLYEGVQEDFDNVAERIVGHGGNQAMDPAAVFAEASAQSAQWISEGASIFSAALVAEQAVQEALMNAYGTMNQSGGLSLGIDDMLMAIASKHETNQYLLKQHDPNGGAVAAPMVEEAPVQGQAAPVQAAVPQEAQAAPAPAQPAPPKTASLRSFFTRTST